MINIPPKRNPTRPSQTETVDALARIESKLDTLIAALADEDYQPMFDLDGNLIGQERDQSEPL